MEEAILLSRRHIAHTVSKKNALLSSQNVAGSNDFIGEYSTHF